MTRAATASRLLLVLLAIVADLLITDYDTSAHELKCLTETAIASSSNLDCLIRRLLGGFGLWDGVYFRRIAQLGYENEQNFAFFPFLPAVLHLFSLLRPAFLSVDAWQLLVGVLFSQTCFVFAARELYKLTLLVFTGPPSSHHISDTTTAHRLARTAGLLFCITPAGIFMSAIYSESPFALLSLLSLRLLAERKPWPASLVLALAGFVRSNAFLLAVFFVASCYRRHSYRPLPSTSLSQFVLAWTACALQCLVTVLPFVATQLYAASLFCPGRPWCNAVPLPSIYSFVQSHYWGNGLFAYWIPKQIPNFLLASPIACFSLFFIARYVLHSARNPARLLADWHVGGSPRAAVANNKHATDTSLLLRPDILPYYLLWAVMLVIALVAMHVQVITRFFCALPPLYWCAASIHSLAVRRLVILYFIIYSLLGALFFPNFYPWT